jgi:acyl-coenzyme A thioesterase PaaI-like protein
MTVTGEAPSTRTLESLLADGWKPMETTGFIGLIGPVLFREDGDDIRFGFVAEPKHENRRGVIQGGMLAAFADRTLAMTARRANNDLPQATIELSVRYVDAVQIGEFVQSVCEVVRKTRSIIFVRGTLTVGSRIVATADGVWKVLSSRHSASVSPRT